MENPSLEEIQELLSRASTIAVLGCSRYPSKDAHRIPMYMQQAGYRIIPVNPFAYEILGEKSYQSLDEIPDDEDIDIVDVFRPSEDVPSIVSQAVPVALMPCGCNSALDTRRPLLKPGMRV